MYFSIVFPQSAFCSGSLGRAGRSRRMTLTSCTRLSDASSCGMTSPPQDGEYLERQRFGNYPTQLGQSHFCVHFSRFYDGQIEMSVHKYKSFTVLSRWRHIAAQVHMKFGVLFVVLFVSDDVNKLRLCNQQHLRTL